jgi:crossover junction endodeoxyribonuclease RuvC
VLFQANTRTAMSVGQASGLALAVAGRSGVPVFHYSPNEVKLAVTGDGTAGKAQVQAMVARLLALAAPPRPADAADALALCVCHLGSAGLRTAVAGVGPVPDSLGRAVAAAIAKESGA